MMKYGAFSQIIIAAIAVLIVITYVRPNFVEIGQMQDKIAEFDVAIDQVSTVNNQLNALVSQVNSVSVADRQALFTYMPDQIDEVAILRDLQRIMEEADVDITELGYGGYDLPAVTDPNSTSDLLAEPVVHKFSIGVLGDYEKVKQVLRSLEENDYPLHVYQLTIGPSQEALPSSDTVEAKIAIETYARMKPSEFSSMSTSKR